MAYEIDAIYSKGAFVPVTPIAIPEGAKVHLHVEEPSVAETTTNKMMSRAEMNEFLRLARELPIESPDDGFSGADHDKLLYG
jgi:predicted DNA-binding antitoxin AbrB/MazE fold protein